MARGDVLCVDLPFPRRGVGHEQAGLRPAIAVQADVPSVNLPTLMIVPLTGQLNALRFPYTIRVEPSKVNDSASHQCYWSFNSAPLTGGESLRRLVALSKSTSINWTPKCAAC